MSDPKILIVDDDPGMLRLLSLRLASEPYDIHTANDAAQALGCIARILPDVVITDLRMDAMDGIALLDEVQSRWPGLPVILLTAHGTIPDAVEATQRGATGFLTKPVAKHELLAQLDSALAMSAGCCSNETWRDAVIGRSNVMDRLLVQARRVAASSASILITGASGSGKEVLARAIHKASNRSGSFVALNSGAIPAELLESELFGHERGAFTGAARERRGLVQCANQGTLFLDEIGDMPPSLQVKLLRVLQEREVRPLGGERTVHVDIRVISATHRDLKEAILDEAFREDLYYRLRVVELRVPGLKERREDIPLLASHFLQNLCRSDANRKSFAPKALELLIAAPWPGNVRQLGNVIEQCHALATGRVIGVRTVAAALGSPVLKVQTFKAARDQFTHEYLSQLLTSCAGNVSSAARLAERNRSDFYKLLARHNIDPSDFKT